MANSFMNQGNAGTFHTINGNVSNLTNINTPLQTPHEPIRFRFYASVSNFTGREDELNLLTISHQNLADQGASIVVVSGMGGIGKTQLVRKFIERNQTNYKNVIWINSENSGVLADEFKMLATNYLSIQRVKEKDFSSLIEEVLNKLSAVPTVIVLDNVDELKNTKIVKTLLTIRTSGITPHVIITSRIKEWPKSIRLIELNVFKVKDAIDYVSTQLTDVKPNDTLDAKIKLVEKLQYFPLALRQATSHINHRRVVGTYQISQYIREFDLCQDRMLGSNFFQNDDLDLYEETTLTTWKVSIAAINKCGTTGRLAVRILRIIAYFDASHIRRDIFLHLNFSSGFPGSQQITDIETEVTSAVRLLVNYSIIDSDHLQSILSIHRLMQQVIRIETDHDSNLIQAILRDGLHIISEMEDIRDCHEHGISIFLLALKFKDLVRDFDTFPFIILRSLLNYGQYVRAINFRSEVLHPLTAILGDNHRVSLKSNVDIRCKHSNKLQMHQEIFEKRKTILWQEDRDTLHWEAKTFRSYDKHSDNALNISQKVFEKRMTNSRVDNPIESHFNIEYVKRADQSQKLAMSQKVLDKRVVDLCEDIPPSLETHFNAGYSKSANNSQTIDLSQNVFEIRTVNTEEDNEDLSNLESHFDAVYVKNADNSEKIDLSGKVCENRNRKSDREDDSENPPTLESHFNVVYVKNADHSETIDVRQKVLAKVRNSEDCNQANLTINSFDCHSSYLKRVDNSKTISLGLRFDNECSETHYFAVHSKQSQQASKKPKDIVIEHDLHHPNVLDSKFNIADLYEYLDNPSTALRMYQEVFDKRKQALGENHLVTLESLSKIATAYNNLEEHLKALEIHQEVFKKRSKILGEYHLDTLQCKSNIAASYNYLGEYLKALNIYEEVLESRRYIFGENHPQTCHSMSKIAELYTNLEKHSDALEMHQEVFERRRNILGYSHLDTVASQLNIAAAYTSLEKHSDALQMHQQVFGILQCVLGQNHMDTITSIANIADSYSRLGKHSDALNMHQDIFLRLSSIYGSHHQKTLDSKLLMEMSARNVIESRLGNAEPVPEPVPRTGSLRTVTRFFFIWNRFLQTIFFPGRYLFQCVKKAFVTPRKLFPNTQIVQQHGKQNVK